MKQVYLSPVITVETLAETDVLTNSPPEENWGPLQPLLPTFE